jgi:malic enzyme
LLLAHVLSLEEQAARVLNNMRRLPDDLEKYVALNALHDRNEALFFRVVCDNIDEIQPLIYTPTVVRGDVIKKVLMDDVGSRAELEQRLQEMQQRGQRNAVLYVGGVNDARWVTIPLRL